MEGRQPPDDHRRIHQNDGPRSRFDRNHTENINRHLPPQHLGNVSSSQSIDSDPARRTNPFDAWRGDDTRAAPIVHPRDQYDGPTSGQVAHNNSQGDRGSYLEIRSRGQGIPNPRVGSAPNPNSGRPNVGFGPDVRSPYQRLHQPQQPQHQQPQYQQSYSYMPQDHLHPSGVANPYVNANTLASDMWRQPTAGFGLPPAPRGTASPRGGAIVQNFPRVPTMPTNNSRTDVRSGTAPVIETPRRVQVQPPIPREQPRQQGIYPNFPMAHGPSIRNPPSFYSSPPYRPPPVGYDPASAIESWNYGPPPNSGTASVYQPFPAYESPESGTARGLPPHLTQPEPLASQRPIIRQHPDRHFPQADDGAVGGRGYGQGRVQATVTPRSGANSTGASRSGLFQVSNPSTQQPRKKRTKRDTTTGTSRVPGCIHHGEVREFPDGLRFQAEGSSRWEPTIYHEPNRRAMIDWANRFGHYTHPPARGAHPDDETAYHPNTQHWRFQGHHGWHSSQDSLLYRFQREDLPVPNYTPGPLRWRGRVVLNREDVPITDWRHMPLTCASIIEGGRMELMQREDERISNQDFRDRQPARSGDRPLPGLSAMGNRKRRFRESNGLASWDVREGTGRITGLIRSHLSEQQLVNNTTRGFDGLTQAELQGVKDENARSGYFKSRAGKKALTDKEKRRRTREKQAKSGKRKRYESDEDDVDEDGDGPSSYE